MNKKVNAFQFLGQSWAAFFDYFDLASKNFSINHNTQISKFHFRDMIYYGHFTCWNQHLNLVICDICHKVLLPQAFYRHIKTKHHQIFTQDNSKSMGFGLPILNFPYFVPKNSYILQCNACNKSFPSNNDNKISSENLSHFKMQNEDLYKTNLTFDDSAKVIFEDNIKKDPDYIHYNSNLQKKYLYNRGRKRKWNTKTNNEPKLNNNNNNNKASSPATSNYYHQTNSINFYGNDHQGMDNKPVTLNNEDNDKELLELNIPELKRLRPPLVLNFKFDQSSRIYNVNPVDCDTTLLRSCCHGGPKERPNHIMSQDTNCNTLGSTAIQEEASVNHQQQQQLLLIDVDEEEEENLPLSFLLYRRRPPPLPQISPSLPPTQKSLLRVDSEKNLINNNNNLSLTDKVLLGSGDQLESDCLFNKEGGILLEEGIYVKRIKELNIARLRIESQILALEYEIAASQADGSGFSSSDSSTATTLTGAIAEVTDFDRENKNFPLDLLVAATENLTPVYDSPPIYHPFTHRQCNRVEESLDNPIIFKNNDNLLRRQRRHSNKDDTTFYTKNCEKMELRTCPNSFSEFDQNSPKFGLSSPTGTNTSIQKNKKKKKRKKKNKEKEKEGCKKDIFRPPQERNNSPPPPPPLSIVLDYDHSLIEHKEEQFTSPSISQPDGPLFETHFDPNPDPPTITTNRANLCRAVLEDCTTKGATTRPTTCFPFTIYGHDLVGRGNNNPYYSINDYLALSSSNPIPPSLSIPSPAIFCRDGGGGGIRSRDRAEGGHAEINREFVSSLLEPSPAALQLPAENGLNSCYAETILRSLDVIERRGKTASSFTSKSSPPSISSHFVYHHHLHEGEEGFVAFLPPPPTAKESLSPKSFSLSSGIDYLERTVANKIVRGAGDNHHDAHLNALHDYRRDVLLVIDDFTMTTSSQSTILTSTPPLNNKFTALHRSDFPFSSPPSLSTVKQLLSQSSSCLSHNEEKFLDDDVAQVICDDPVSLNPQCQIKNLHSSIMTGRAPRNHVINFDIFAKLSSSYLSVPAVSVTKSPLFRKA